MENKLLSHLQQRTYFDEETVIVNFDGRVLPFVQNRLLRLIYENRPLLIRQADWESNPDEVKQSVKDYFNAQPEAAEAAVEHIVQNFMGYWWEIKKVRGPMAPKDIYEDAISLLMELTGYKRDDYRLKALEKFLREEGVGNQFNEILTSNLRKLYERGFKISEKKPKEIIDEIEKKFSLKLANAGVKEKIFGEILLQCKNKFYAQALSYALSYPTFSIFIHSDLISMKNMQLVFESFDRPVFALGKSSYQVGWEMIHVYFNDKNFKHAMPLQAVSNVYGGISIDRTMQVDNYDSPLYQYMAIADHDFTAVFLEEIIDFCTEMLEKEHETGIGSLKFNRVSTEFNDIYRDIGVNLLNKLLLDKPLTQAEEKTWLVFKKLIEENENNIVPKPRILITALSEGELDKKVGGAVVRSMAPYGDASYRIEEILSDTAEGKPIAVLYAPPVVKGDKRVHIFALENFINRLYSTFADVKAFYSQEKQITELVGRLPALFIYYPELTKYYLKITLPFYEKLGKIYDESHAPLKEPENATLVYSDEPYGDSSMEGRPPYLLNYHIAGAMPYYLSNAPFENFNRVLGAGPLLGTAQIVTCSNDYRNVISVFNSDVRIEGFRPGDVLKLDGAYSCQDQLEARALLKTEGSRVTIEGVSCTQLLATPAVNTVLAAVKSNLGHGALMGTIEGVGEGLNLGREEIEAIKSSANEAFIIGSNSLLMISTFYLAKTIVNALKLRGIAATGLFSALTIGSMLVQTGDTSFAGMCIFALTSLLISATVTSMASRTARVVSRTVVTNALEISHYALNANQ